MRSHFVAVMAMTVSLLCGTAQAQDSAAGASVPDQLVVIYKTPAAADAAMSRIDAANKNNTLRGAGGPALRADASAPGSLVVTLGDAAFGGVTRGDPTSRLQRLQEIGRQIKAADPQVQYVFPNWRMSIAPPPSPVPPGSKALDKLNRLELNMLKDGSTAPEPGSPTGYRLGVDGPAPDAPGLPDDKYLSLQWSLLPPPRGMNAVGAWKYTKGSDDVVVAVIDTGIAAEQEDFAGSSNLLDSVNFVGAGSLPECDDEPKPGASGVDLGDDRPTCRQVGPGELNGKTRPVTQADPLRPSWHGSHVAGVIGAASTNNERGIAAINWKVRVLPIRALSARGGSQWDVLLAVDWAAGVEAGFEKGTLVPFLQARGIGLNLHPADIVNLSLGHPNVVDGRLVPCAQTEGNSDDAAIWKETIEAARAHGSVIVAAAGNADPGLLTDSDGRLCTTASGDCQARPIDVKYIVPAGCPRAIAVAASDMNGHLASYSFFGEAISVMAPGGDGGLLRLVRKNGAPVLDDDGRPIDAPFGWIWSTVAASYDFEQGTSMAAPHVSGALALALAAHPEMRGHPDWIERLLRNNLAPLPEGACSPERPCGRGLLDAERLVNPPNPRDLQRSPFEQ